MLRDEARREIALSPFAGEVSALEGVMIPVTRLKATRADAAAIAVGGTHFGGAPDVPKGFIWPKLGEVPLAFLAQIRLQDVPAVSRGDLPETGWLLFFYEMEKGSWGFDPKDRETFRVVFFDGPQESLQRAALPSTLPASGRGLQWSAVSLTPGVSLPDPSDDVFKALGIDLSADGAQESYLALANRVAGIGPDDAYHHLLGYPQIIQDDMRSEVQLASRGVYMGSGQDESDPRMKELAAGAADWELLLQLDTDEGAPGWMWGDMGTVYFWIRKQDLAARKFDAAWMILQCY